MARKAREPQYIKSILNTPMLNYRIYVMSGTEKLITFLLAFGVGGILGITFYGGQFRDADGLETPATFFSNIIIFCVVGIAACFAFFPMRRNQLQKKRRRELANQFCSFLESLSVSLSSGMNMTNSLVGAYEDLKGQYSEGAYIVKEVREMVDGMRNNVQIEQMMLFFGERSGMDDIKNFGTVFEICYRSGGNLKEIVRRTNSIISEKIEISNEIETALSSNKSQFLIMMVIPVIIVLMLRMTSGVFAESFSTVTGVICVTVAVGIFIAAYVLGQRIMDVKG